MGTRAVRRDLTSLSYLDGPKLAWLDEPKQSNRFLWLLPVTGAERNYAIEQGVEAFARAFRNPEANYADPFRQSVT